jgi:hypothetical protein
MQEANAEVEGNPITLLTQMLSQTPNLSCVLIVAETPKSQCLYYSLRGTPSLRYTSLSRQTTCRNGAV